MKKDLDSQEYADVKEKCIKYLIRVLKHSFIKNKNYMYL